MEMAGGSATCETCGQRFWPHRLHQRYGCDYCGAFPERVRSIERDHARYPHTIETRPVPVFEEIECTCPRGAA